MAEGSALYILALRLPVSIRARCTRSDSSDSFLKFRLVHLAFFQPLASHISTTRWAPSENRKNLNSPPPSPMGRQAWLNRFVLGRSSSSIPDWQYYLDTGRYIQLSDDEINSPETTYKWVDPNPPDKVYKCIDVDNLECYGHTYDEKGHPYSKAARAQSYFQGAAETAIVLAALERAKRAAAEEQNREDVEETNEAQHRAATIEETEGGQEKLRDCVSWAVKICMKNAVMLTPMVNQTVVFKSCGDMGVTQHFLWSVRAHGFLAPFASGMLESLALASKQPAALLYPFEVLVGKLFGRQWVPMVEKSVTW